MLMMQKLLVDLYYYMECTGICLYCQNVRVTVDTKNDYKNNGHNGPAAFCPHCKSWTPNNSQKYVAVQTVNHKIKEFAQELGRTSPDLYLKNCLWSDGVDIGKFNANDWASIKMPAARSEYRNGIPRRAIANYMSNSLAVVNFDLGRKLTAVQSVFSVRNFIQYLKDVRRARNRLEEIGFTLDCANPPAYGTKVAKGTKEILDEGMQKLVDAGVVKETKVIGFGAGITTDSEPAAALLPHEVREKIKANMAKIAAEKLEKENKEKDLELLKSKAALAFELSKKKKETEAFASLTKTAEEAIVALEQEVESIKAEAEILKTEERITPTSTPYKMQLQMKIALKESELKGKEAKKTELQQALQHARQNVAEIVSEPIVNDEEKPKLTEAEYQHWRVSQQQPSKEKSDSFDYRRFMSKIDAAGTTTEFYYGEKNKLIRMIVKKRGEAEVETRYAYNDNGDILTELANFGTPEQTETRYEYDGKTLVARIYDYGTPKQNVFREPPNLGCTPTETTNEIADKVKQAIANLKPAPKKDEFEISSFEIIEEHAEESDEIGELGSWKGVK
jgi:hypothetical protein